MSNTEALVEEIKTINSWNNYESYENKGIIYIPRDTLNATVSRLLRILEVYEKEQK